MRWKTGAVLVLIISGALAQAATAPQAVRDLRTDFPAVQTYVSEAGLSRIYGAPFAFGASVEETAAAFVTTRSDIFGLSAGELLPGNGFNGQYTQPLMYDPETGQYKFTLVYYRQYRNGLPVYGAELRLLVRNQDADHPLVLAASTLRDLGDYQVPATAVARAADGNAHAAAMQAAPGLEKFSGNDVVVWAGDGKQTLTPRVALTFVAEGTSPDGEPLKSRYVVDAETNEVLHAENLILFTDVTGSVSGMASEGPKADFCANEVSTPMPYARVCIGSTCVYADGTGVYTIPNSGTSAVTVTSGMAGQYFYVDNVAGAEESLTLTVTPPGPANFMHNQANTSEAVRAQINGYVQANAVREFILAANPSYPTISGQVNFPVYVNRTDGYCPGNAWYDGVAINFCSSSSSYPNTAWQSVLWHEYGHHVVEVGGSGQGQYGEGMGDVVAMLGVDDPHLGYGFYLDCNGWLRMADNTYQYPCTSDIHTCAQLLSGCVWSTRNEFVTSGYTPAQYLPILAELAVNSVLVHSGESITPSITSDWLTLDDDDGDLSNGTPHYAEITAGFGAHSMWAGPPPANDFCADAINACPGTYTGSTSSATNDGAASCGTSDSSPDVWYRYLPLTNGTLTAGLCSGTAYDAVLSIHSGCPGTSGNTLGCDDDGCGSTGGPSTVTISVTANTTYYIRVTGYNGAAGPYGLTISGPDCGGIALTLSFPSGLPDTLPPGQPTPVTIQIEDGSEAYVPGSGLLHYRYDGGTWLSAALTSQGGNLYQATLPAPACTDTPEFYFSAAGDGGTTAYAPLAAPADVYTAAVGALTTVISDNFENDLGWTTDNGTATAGFWQRGVPVNDSSWDYDPISDADGSGKCWLTQNVAGNTDVDGGYVVLYSPVLDMTSGNITISYDYYLYLTNTDGSDRLLVEISSNGSAGPWTELVRHTSNGGLAWRHHEIGQAALDTAGVTLTANMMLRFTANDGGTASIVEAGLDAFNVSGLTCESITDCNQNGIDDAEDIASGTSTDVNGNAIPDECELVGDTNCDGVVDFGDINPFVALLVNGTTPCDFARADINGDGAIDFGDINPFVTLLTH